MKTPTLDDQLCFALYAASSHVTSLYRPHLSAIGITYPQFLVLMALWEEDDVTISNLSVRTSLGKSTLTPLLKLLEQKLLITRNMGESDERQKHIVLTREGRKLSKKAGKISEATFCQTGMSRKDADRLMKLCHMLVRSGAAK